MKKMNILFHLRLRELYGYTAIRGKEHYVLLNVNMDKIPPELLE